jgi:hypothetical protein
VQKSKLLKFVLAALVAVILAIPLVNPVSAATIGSQQASYSGDNAQAVNLSAAEVNWLTYMREEEKLARDVYLYLYGTSNLRSFNNIAKSEQRHTDAIKSLMDNYGIPDPAANTGKGEFTNPELQALYNELISRGSASLIEALKAGILVEKTDIADLDKAIASTAQSEINNVYTNLKNGSLNHLQAFNSNLANR